MLMVVQHYEKILLLKLNTIYYNVQEIGYLQLIGHAILAMIKKIKHFLKYIVCKQVVFSVVIIMQQKITLFINTYFISTTQHFIT